MANILIVDDEHNIRLMIRLALQVAGHTVATAPDGAEALEQFGEGSAFDLVLLDQRMPGMDGLEVLREMKRRQPEARVIIITAVGTVDLAAQAIRAGAMDFLRKPFTADMLRDSVSAALKDHNRPGSVLPADEKATAHWVAVNGYRVESSGLPVERQPDGGLQLQFAVRAANGDSTGCSVLLPRFFMELVKAYADREDLDSDEQFWLWLGEEALANHLWQHSGPPPGGSLTLDELTTSLRRWTEAVLSQP